MAASFSLDPSNRIPSLLSNSLLIIFFCSTAHNLVLVMRTPTYVSPPLYLEFCKNKDHLYFVIALNFHPLVLHDVLWATYYYPLLQKMKIGLSHRCGWRSGTKLIQGCLIFHLCLALHHYVVSWHSWWITFSQLLYLLWYQLADLTKTNCGLKKKTVSLSCEGLG